MRAFAPKERRRRATHFLRAASFKFEAPVHDRVFAATGQFLKKLREGGKF
jgi:hypothetical protein